jgi:hypothetical protein
VSSDIINQHVSVDQPGFIQDLHTNIDPGTNGQLHVVAQDNITTTIDGDTLTKAVRQVSNENVFVDKTISTATSPSGDMFSASELIVSNSVETNFVNKFTDLGVSHVNLHQGFVG